MNYKPRYQDSEYTDNDEIYDEETDYYTEDCDLCNDYEDRTYFKDMSYDDEGRYWK